MLIPHYTVGALVLGVITAWFILTRKKRTFLTMEKKQPVKLIAKETLSHDVRKFRFELPPNTALGLQAGRHIIASTNKPNGVVARNYSPVSAEEAEGYFELNVKIYLPNEKFPQGGQFSQFLESLQIGDTIDIKGPIGKCFYSGPSELSLLAKGGMETRKASTIAMMAGGVGITPFLAIIRKIFSNPADKTKVSLLFANQTEEDIFLRQELEAYASKYSNFKLWYTLDRPPQNWKYSSGFINATMIKEHLFEGDVAPSVFLLCGPPPMIKYACMPNLTELGVKESDVIAW